MSTLLRSSPPWFIAQLRISFSEKFRSVPPPDRMRSLSSRIYWVWVCELFVRLSLFHLGISSSPNPAVPPTWGYGRGSGQGMGRDLGLVLPREWWSVHISVGSASGGISWHTDSARCPAWTWPWLRLFQQLKAWSWRVTGAGRPTCRARLEPTATTAPWWAGAGNSSVCTSPLLKTFCLTG